MKLSPAPPAVSKYGSSRRSPTLGAAALSPAKFSDVDTTSIQISASSCLRITLDKRFRCPFSALLFDPKFSAVYSWKTFSLPQLFCLHSGVDLELLHIWKATLQPATGCPVSAEKSLGAKCMCWCISLLYTAEQRERRRQLAEAGEPCFGE